MKRYTAKDPEVPRPYRVTVHVACWEGSPQLAEAFCSPGCGIATYEDGPDGFLRQRITLPGYVVLTCRGCGQAIHWTTEPQ